MNGDKIIPVLDLMGGIVVRGVAGQRDKYQPNQSLLTNSAEPLETAKAIAGHFDCRRFYIADLDAILARGDHQDAITELLDNGFDVLLDAGIASVDQLQRWSWLNCEFVIGLETLRSWSDLQDMVEASAGQPLTFSLDLKQGHPLGDLGRGQSPREVFATALDLGMTRFIVLDLAGVGVSQGIPTLGLVRDLRVIAPTVELITGGGVRDRADIDAAVECGANGVLVASAIHDGRLAPH